MTYTALFVPGNDMQKTKYLYMILGYYTGGYEEFYRMGHKAMFSIAFTLVSWLILRP
jgi:hypothetical protein